MSNDLLNRLHYLQVISEEIMKQGERQELSSFYAMIMKEIRLKNQISGSRLMGKKFCKKCLSFKICSKTGFKLKNKALYIKCNQCNYVKKYQLKKNGNVK